MGLLPHKCSTSCPKPYVSKAGVAAYAVLCTMQCAASGDSVGHPHLKPQKVFSHV